VKTLFRLPVATIEGYQPYPTGEEPKASRTEEMEDSDINTSKTTDGKAENK